MSDIQLRTDILKLVNDTVACARPAGRAVDESVATHFYTRIGEMVEEAIADHEHRLHNGPPASWGCDIPDCRACEYRLRHGLSQ